MFLSAQEAREISNLAIKNKREECEKAAAELCDGYFKAIAEASAIRHTKAVFNVRDIDRLTLHIAKQILADAGYSVQPVSLSEPFPVYIIVKW